MSQAGRRRRGRRAQEQRWGGRGDASERGHEFCGLSAGRSAERSEWLAPPSHPRPRRLPRLAACRLVWRVVLCWSVPSCASSVRLVGWSLVAAVTRAVGAACTGAVPLCVACIRQAEEQRARVSCPEGSDGCLPRPCPSRVLVALPSSLPRRSASERWRRPASDKAREGQRRGNRRQQSEEGRRGTSGDANACCSHVRGLDDWWEQ